MPQKKQLELQEENNQLKTQLAEACFERDKYKKLFEASGDALSIIDLSTGKFIECNQSAIYMHGVESKANFLNISPSAISPEFQTCGGTSEELATNYIGKAHSEGPQLFQWIHSKLDGSTFPCLVSLSAVQIQDKNLILAIGRDISDLAFANEQLEEANTNLKRYKIAYQKEKMKFEKFVNLAPVGIAVNSLQDGAFQYVNNEFSKMTGYTVDELNTLDYWEITPEKYADDEQIQVSNLMQTGRYGPYNKEYIHKNGNTFPVLLSGIKVTDPEEGDFIWSVVQDTTEQKEAEKQLSKAREQADLLALRMQLANNSAEIGVWELDLLTNELIWDELMYQLHGLSEDSFPKVYEAWENTVHPDDLESTVSQLQTAITGNGRFDAEFRVIHSSGELRTLKASSKVIHNTAGKAVKMIGVNYDVTDKVNAIGVLEIAKNTAEKSSQAKGDFLANMSHEIRTPMNAILGGLQLLESANLDAELYNVLANASFSAKSLLTIINDILDYSKIESNKIELESAPIFLFDILESVHYDLDALISHKMIDFDTVIDDDFEDGWIGDIVRVKQIILNLVSNAVKFTDKGAVKIHVKCISHKGKKAIQLSIEDNGIGMDVDAKNRIFDRFSQADTSTTRKYGGTGLGMSITISLVQLMDGELSVESEVGQGTTINVVLPLDKAKEHLKSEQRKSLNPPDLTGKKVLIAEDNRINQILVKTMLKSTRAELVIVENGALAIEVLEQQKFDLILMDIHMPVMDGVEAIKAIRAKSNNIPVIALTANVMVEDVKNYLDSGFDAHIPKPIELPVFYGTLASYR